MPEQNSPNMERGKDIEKKTGIRFVKNGVDKCREVDGNEGKGRNGYGTERS